MKPSIPLSFLLVTICLMSPAQADEVGQLVLVRDGQSVAPIVVSEEAGEAASEAALELAEYIEKISGGLPEIMVGLPDPMPASAIWVGYQPVLDELLPEVDFGFTHPEEILIILDDQNLVIAGRDVVVGDVQLEFGTANAVYTFLQDQLGVRWLWPGELGEDYPVMETIALNPFETRYHPPIRGRSGVIRMSAADANYRTSPEWTRRQRLQLDSLAIPGGHAFTTWWERFHEEKPEFFALQPDGSRGGGDEPYPSQRTVKMCKSNPDLWEQWLADVEQQLAEHPDRRVFNASPNDGWGSGWCICQDCLAWDHPDGEPRRFSWQGLSQDYVALSDRQLTFANTVARMLKEKYPDEDYYVLMMAYGHSRPVPIEAVPDDNVIVASVANFLFRRDEVDRGSTWGTTHVEQFEGWGDVAGMLAWRPNTGNPGGWQDGWPHVPFTETAEEFRIAADNNTVSIFIDTVWEHWATQGPLYYLMAQLSWDPYLDPEAVMDDYYARAFGPAAEPMKKYWQHLEARTEYSDEFLAQGYEYLDQALAAADGAPEKYRERVEYVRLGLDYTALQVETRELMARFEESGKTDTEAENKARENWLAVREIAKENDYVINWGPIRPRTGRGGPAPQDLKEKPPGW